MNVGFYPVNYTYNLIYFNLNLGYIPCKHKIEKETHLKKKPRCEFLGEKQNPDNCFFGDV